MLFLDIASDTVVDAAQQASRALDETLGQTHTSEKMNFMMLLMQGGALMVPLGVLLIIALWVFFERLFVIRQALRYDLRFMPTIKDHIVSGNMHSARVFAKASIGPVYRVIEKGIQRIGKPIDVIENSMENIGRVEMYRLEKRLSTLSIIAGIAPMFGFLGTIVGMIKLFFGISSTGEYTLSTIAAGIYTKMVTSAAGLIIGLLAYVAYNYLNALIDKLDNRIQSASAEFMDILQEPQPVSNLSTGANL